MLEEVSEEIKQVRASGLSDLINVVALQFKLYIDLLHSFYKTHGRAPTFDEIQNNYPETKSFSIISQTFTAMIIEAFYFDYCHGKQSKGSAEKWSKQSPIKQFEQLSEVYLKVSNYTETDIYAKLQDLNKVRKRWVHNQSTQIGKYKKNLNYLSPDGCIQLLREFFEYFHTHDKSCITASLTFDALTHLQIQYKGFSGPNAP